MPNRSPIASITGGLIAGAIGTLAMDALWYRRYRADGGTDSFASWEFSDADSFSDAGAPAQVGKRVLEAVTDVEVEPEAAGATTTVVHWVTGLGWGALHGLATADIYKPIWEYEPADLWKDLSAHLVFGLSTAAAFVAVSRLTDR